MKKTIDLGLVHMSSYTPDSRLGPDYYFDPKDSDYNDDYAKEIRALKPDEEVLPSGKYVLEISYPLTNPFLHEFETKGMTRRELVNLIVESYKEIYKSEEDPGYIPGMLNRAASDGQYGIWGHHMSDLDLHTAYVKGKTITVSCDS
jgi:hypothetical protein